MKSTRLFLKNAFRTAFRNLSQILGLSFLVMIVSMVTALLSATTSRVVNSYNSFANESNQHQIILPIEMNDKFDVNDNNFEDIKKAYKLSNTQEAMQQYIINKILEDAKTNKNWDINVTRTEGRILSNSTYKNSPLSIKAIAKTGYVFNGVENKNVDKLVISLGRDINYGSEYANNEIVVNEQFAIMHNIGIGSIIRLQQDEYGSEIDVKTNSEVKAKLESVNDDILKFDPNILWFKIVGFGSSVDFTMPIIQESSVIPNTLKEGIVYVNTDKFGLFKEQLKSGVEFYNYNATAPNQLTISSEYDKELFYSFSFKEKSIYENNKAEVLKYLNSEFLKYSGIKINKEFFKDQKDSTYKFVSRTEAFAEVIKAYQTTSSILLIIIIGISVFTIVLLTRKQIDNVKTQIGYFKALGYKKREIVNNFIAVPVIVSLIGSFLGYGIAAGIEPTTVAAFWNYFSIPHMKMSFNVFSFVYSIFVVFLILFFISLAIAYFVIKDKPLELLNSSGKKGISKLGISLKKTTKNKKFNTRLRTALLTTSIGKLAGVGLTMLLGTILMTSTIISPKLLQDNIDATFTGLNYNNQIEYANPVANNPMSYLKKYDPSQESWEWEEYKEGSNTISSPLMSKKQDGEAWINLDEKDNFKSYNTSKIFKMISDGTINDQFYAIDANTTNGLQYNKMSYLNWYNLSSYFLKALENYAPSTLDNIAIKPLGQQWTDHFTMHSLISTLNNSDYKTKFIALSNFYKKYINTIGLSINASLFEDNNINKNISSEKFKKLLASEISSKATETYGFGFVDLNLKDQGVNFESLIDLSSKNDLNLDLLGINKDNFKIKKLYKSDVPFDLNDIDINKDKQELIEKVNGQLLMWYALTFSHRLGQYILQTTYSRAPYFVQQYMKNNLNNGKNYNILFNVVPVNPSKDEVGTMLNGTFKSKIDKTEKLKIFGINKNTKLLDLKDSNNNNLLLNTDFWNSNKTSNEIPIIINQTTAKKLDKHIGSTFDTSLLNEFLYADGNKLDLNKKEDIDLTFLKFEKYLNPSKQYTASLAGNMGNVGKIKKKEIANYSSALPPAILESVKKGELKNETVNKQVKFKIVGIQNGYGRSQAWIPNNVADKLTEFDKLKNFLFKNQFLYQYAYYEKDSEEFKSLFGPNEDSLLPKYGSEIREFVTNDGKNNIDYDSFIEKINSIKNEDEKKEWMKFDDFFNNQYGVFNYKNQSDEKMVDITNGFTTVQKFGDYSAYGLNGGYEQDGGQYYQGYGMGAVSTMAPAKETRQILTQITSIVNSVVILFIIIALIVSTTITLLVVNLIIYENQRFISTLKVLGYTNKYIIRQILGMYLSIILIMFGIGFLIGWFSFVLLIKQLALNTSWVLPISFTWWLPFAVFGIMFGVYVLTFIISYSKVKNINPVDALKMI